MVIQSGIKVPVWGWAVPGEEIAVTIDQQTKTGTADANGKWMVHLDPMETGVPRTMTVKSKSSSQKVIDILLGEVWICSGQSNMQWPLSQSQDGAKEIAGADLPNVRLFNLVRGGANRSTEGGPAQQVVDGIRDSRPYKEAWQICSPATAKDNFSAIAFFFGRDLQAKLHVPIGLISNPVGGSCVESWISREAFLADADLNVVPKYFDALVAHAQTPAGQAELAADYANYEAMQNELRAQGKPLMWPPHHEAAPERDGFTSVWFNSRVNPLIPFALRGVIWYQGEAQTYKPGDLRGEYPRDYQHLFPLLIKDWRARWGQGDFPFLFVQLPNWSKPRPEPSFDGWSVIREAQLKALRVPNTGMAVAIDVGDPESIHPINKQPVGTRLALAARAIAYGEKIVYSGPIYREMKVERDSIRLSFDHIGSGLEARGGELKQFAIAGEDMKFVWASARIDGNEVVVHSDMVSKPIAVRYATATNPIGCNLYNKEGLPASPFRTDDDATIEKGAYYKRKIKEPLSLRP